MAEISEVRKMNDAEKTDWGKSVAGVVIRDEKVLLVRHTYGAGKGMLIVPGIIKLYT